MDEKWIVYNAGNLHESWEFDDQTSASDYAEHEAIDPELGAWVVAKVGDDGLEEVTEIWFNQEMYS